MMSTLSRPEFATHVPDRPDGVAVGLVGLRRNFREYYVFFGVVTREFVALDRRVWPWREVAAHRDPNSLAAMLRVHRASAGR
ncbi:hypothetical protein [Actinomadura chokoriensis]|uniref:Uncharacterized protein n=1 Tax=Actinomadura chokoriensis TaxID=454156 RepID=A0ABV4R858_9ACTN